MAAIVGPPRATSSPPQEQSQTPSYFEIVTSNLLKLGALTLEDFLRDPYQEPAPRENFLSNPLYHDVPIAPLVVPDQGTENGKPAPTPAPIFILDQICSQTFGSVNALNYEIIEEEGKEKKLCILTITRPNGATRSYTSRPEFARKAEARAAAAAIAVEMGAIDFIKYGSPEAVAKRGLVLAPLDAPGSVQEPSATDAEEDPAVKEIEKCCAEWRAGRVKPCWIFLVDSKPTGKYGCALQIKLSLHLFRVCSVDVIHPSFEMAKAACAADAIAEGILDFIMFGNGQTTPAEKRLFEPQQDDFTSTAPPVTFTLQGFFEALPRPLPEPVDDKTVAEINAPGWLNTLIQSARGGKFEHKFIWTTDTKLGTHGAVLRLTRPGEVRTYMVVPQFPKRADAKNAVCLAALAADVGSYVRTISATLEAKVSSETKALVYESILPLLNTEYAKFWPNKLPEMFEYTKDRDACGCIMTLKLTEQPEEHEKCSWTVPADFRNRNDAKVAVVHAAFEQGAIEFLRFKGESPPEGYKVELPPPRESKKAKRKAADGTENEGEPPKKAKLLSQAEQFLASTLSSKSTEPRPSGTGPSKPSRPLLSTSAEPIFLPRPGYVDPKPEPGELPSEPPTYQPEYPPTSTPWWPTTQPSFNRPTREYPPHPTAESSSSFPFRHRSPSNEPRGTHHSYDTREHGHHQFELGDSRYDGPGVYASDPYYAPPPAPHTEPWHVRPPFSGYSEERDAYSRSYRDIDYGRGYDYDYDYDYGYERGRYTPPPPPSPPAGPRGRGNADYERSEYDYDYDYAREGSYSQPVHHYTQYPQPRPPPAELTSGPMLSSPRRWVPAPAPAPSPPRVWEPGPRVAEIDATRRRSGTSEPRPVLSGKPSEPSEPSFTRASSEVILEPGLVPESTLVSTSAPGSTSVSLSPTPASSSTHAHNTVSVPSKEELFEYCKTYGYPPPRFFDEVDGSGGAAQVSVRYKVWVVLGSERFELPTTYAGINEGEEKMARKVLRLLRSRDMEEV